MSNTIDIIRPSYIGIPNCINETVSITNDLAQCVGTDARWPSGVRRSMTGEVAGECYKTDTALPETVNMIKHGQLMQARLTAEEVTADRVGRAVTQYRYRLQQIEPALPWRDALFALYVPRWQAETDRQILRDYASTHNMSLIGDVSWQDDSIYFDGNTRDNYAISDTFNYTVDNYTILANRDVNDFHDLNQVGFKTNFSLSSYFACEVIERYRTNQKVIGCECGGTETRFPFEDMPPHWTYQTNETYNGLPLTRGSRRAWRELYINHATHARADFPMWTRVSALAIWTRDLTPDEIEQAKLFLSYAPRPTDM